MNQDQILIVPDCDRFPLDAADRSVAEGAGLRLVELNGHDIDAFASHRDTAVAALVWGGRFDRATFEALPMLRVVARCGAGYDNIDLAEAKARGVVVTCVPAASSEEVAEHTIALLLAWARQLIASDSQIRAGGWPSAARLAPMARVHGSKLGLVGFGRIARLVAVKGRGLGMTVGAHDPHVDEHDFAEFDVVRYTELAELLAVSDYVSLHVPLSERTRGVVGARELDMMPSHAVLINASRGKLVDTDALVQALRAETIAGAALDVLDIEPIPPSHPLVSMSRVILTPHSAAFSDQALAEIRRTALADVVNVLEGRPPRHLVR